MKTRWVDNNGAPKELLDRIDACLLKKDDRVIVLNPTVEWHIDALLICIKHSYDLDHETLFQLLHLAVLNVTREGKKLNEKLLINKFKESCEIKLSEPKNYVLVTSVSYTHLTLPTIYSV